MTEQKTMPSIIVSAFVQGTRFFKDKYVLIQCRKFNDWRVPGGHVEMCEDPIVALRREMKEELGVQIRNIVFLGWGFDHNKAFDGIQHSRVVLYFKCMTRDQIKPQDSEIRTFTWLTIESIMQRDNLEKAMYVFFERCADARVMEILRSH